MGENPLHLALRQAPGGEGRVDSSGLAPWGPLARPHRPGPQPVHPSAGQLGQGEVSRASPGGQRGLVGDESGDADGTLG